MPVEGQSVNADTETSPGTAGAHLPQHPRLTRDFYPGRHRGYSSATIRTGRNEDSRLDSSLTPQEIDQTTDMMDDSSSNWIDIADPALVADDYAHQINDNNNTSSPLAYRVWQRLRGSTNNNGNARSTRGRRRRRNNTIKFRIPSLLCDCVVFFFDWTFAAVELWMEILAAPPFPTETLQKVSIVLLAVEAIRDNIDHSALLVALVNTNNADPNQISVGADGTWTLTAVPQYLVWGVPAAIGMLSASFVLTLQLTWGHQEEAVIATALILLIFLEALLPLFILGCTSMFLFQQVSWETGLALLLVVWLGSTFCAHCIRRMLYQSLGHG